MNISVKTAMSELSFIASDIFADSPKPCHLAFLSSFPVLFGRSSFVNDELYVDIGVKGLPGSPFDCIARMPESEFTKLGVTIFHERRHCDQHFGVNVPFEATVSFAARYNNGEWYNQYMHHLPFEIDAERYGISQFWDTLSERFPFDADRMMLDYVNFRADGICIYCIPHKPEGYQSRREVEVVFDRAYADSLNKPRESFVLPRGQCCEDEFVNILRLNDRNSSPFWDFYWDNFSGKIPGRTIDRNMVAVGMVRHEEEYRQQFGSVLDDISFESCFGRSYDSFLKSEPKRKAPAVAPKKNAGASARCLALAEEIEQKSPDGGDFDYS